MRRALIGTVTGWAAGAACLFAQAPMSPLPSPYANYGQAAGRPNYGPQFGAAPNYGPVANYGPSAPMNTPSYGPVNSGPMAPSGHVMPAGGAPMDVPPGTAMPAPAPTPIGPGMTVPGNGAINPAPNGIMAGPVGTMPHGQVINNPIVPGPVWNHGIGDASHGPWGHGGWNGYGDGCWDGSCYGNCMPGCGPCPNGVCGPAGRMWINAELLLWWAKGQYLPPLVTRGVDAVNPGILGQPGTQILFGNNTIGDYLRAGVRARAGAWIDQCQNIGFEASFAFLGIADDRFQTVCRVGDVISRPFFNVDPAVNAQDAELVCLPGVLSGDVMVDTVSEFYMADANVRRNLCCGPMGRVDIAGGFRYAHLNDDVNITEILTNLDPARGVVGEGFVVNDRFQTWNNFYGGQIGAVGEFRSGKVFLDWRALIAFGATVRTVQISGSTLFLDPVPGGNPVRQPGGLLALPSNIGTYTSSEFSVIPEVNVNLGYQITPMVRAYIGYSFLYWNNVARAGEQIDLNVDPAGLPSRAGPGVIGTAPNFNLVPNDFWIHGLSFGGQLRW